MGTLGVVRSKWTAFGPAAGEWSVCGPVVDGSLLLVGGSGSRWLRGDAVISAGSQQSAGLKLKHLPLGQNPCVGQGCPRSGKNHRILILDVILKTRHGRYLKLNHLPILTGLNA